MKTTEQKARQAALCDGVKLSLINNGVLAIVLLCFGALLNHTLERKRERDAFISEFNKIKAQKIGESWAELNEWEARLDILSRVWIESMENLENGIRPTKKDNDEYSKLYNETIGYDKLFLIERNRFWVGREQFILMGDFAALVSRKAENVLSRNLDSIAVINKQIDQKRIEIDEVVSNMVGEKPNVPKK